MQTTLYVDTHTQGNYSSDTTVSFSLLWGCFEQHKLLNQSLASMSGGLNPTALSLQLLHGSRTRTMLLLFSGEKTDPNNTGVRHCEVPPLVNGLPCTAPAQGLEQQILKGCPAFTIGNTYCVREQPFMPRAARREELTPTLASEWLLPNLRGAEAGVAARDVTTFQSLHFPLLL